MKLSPNFDLSEFIDSPAAKQHKIDNTAPPGVLKNLIFMAQNMEVVRKLLNHPICITSGYRCEALNALVGGVSNSAHMEGYAADFVCPEFGPVDEIIDFIKDKLEFDQLIDEHRNGAHWVHISFSPEMRNQVFKVSGRVR